MNQIAFARGVPAPDMLPLQALQEASVEMWSKDAGAVLGYGPGFGYSPLREHLAKMHAVDAKRIVVTTGSLQGFALVAELLREKSTADVACVAVENPTYDRPLILLQRAGIKTVEIETDAEGIVPESLDACFSQHSPSMLYTIPTFQNPGGMTMSIERRKSVLALAQKHDVLIFEDDPYGELWFDSAPPPTLFELGSDGDSRVIHARSFSKTVSPGIRVGYLILPDEVLAGEIERLANDTYITPSLPTEALLLRYRESGHYESHVEWLRGELHRRRDLMVEAIRTHLPDARVTAPLGGYFIWVDVPGSDTSLSLSDGAKSGVTWVPGNAFGSNNRSSMRLAYSSSASADIPEGIRRIAESLAVSVG